MAEVKLDIIIKAMDQASGVFGKIGAAGEAGRRKMAAFGQQAVVAGAAVTAAFTGAAVAAAKFNEGIAEVATLVDLTKVNMDKLKDGVNEVAVSTGKSANDLTKALYDIVSAGVDAADATDVLTVAAKMAVAGVTEASVAVDGITSALNAYNLEASEAEHVSDLFLTAVEKGKTTVEELSSSIGRVAPTAAAMGISLEETLGALSAMTLGGISTRESVSGLKAALANVLRPGKEAEEMAAALSIEFNAAALESKGLVPFLNEVSEAADGDATKMNQLFGSVEGVNAVLAITGENAGKTADVMTAMGDSAGATAEKFKIMSDTTTASWGRMKESFMRLVRTVGDVVIPALETLMGLLEPILGVLQKIADHPVGGFLLKVAAAAGVLALVLGGTLLAVVKVQTAMATMRAGMILVSATMKGTLVPAIAAVGSAFLTFMLSPIGLVIAALAVLVKAIWFAFDEWKKATAAQDAAFASKQQLRFTEQQIRYKKAWKEQRKEGEEFYDWLDRVSSETVTETGPGAGKRARQRGEEQIAMALFASEARRRQSSATSTAAPSAGGSGVDMQKILKQSDELTKAIGATAVPVAAAAAAAQAATADAATPVAQAQAQRQAQVQTQQLGLDLETGEFRTTKTAREVRQMERAARLATEGGAGRRGAKLREAKRLSYGGVGGGAVSATAGGTIPTSVDLNIVARGGSFENWLRNFIGQVYQESQAAHSYQGG